MPCYEVQTMSVEFVAKHRDLLEKALKALNFNYTIKGDTLVIDHEITIDLKAEKAVITYTNTGMSANGVKDKTRLQEKLNSLKRGYSMEAIKKAAYMNGWSLGRATSKSLGVVTGQLTKY